MWNQLRWSLVEESLTLPTPVDCCLGAYRQKSYQPPVSGSLRERGAKMLICRAQTKPLLGKLYFLLFWGKVLRLAYCLLTYTITGIFIENKLRFWVKFSQEPIIGLVLLLFNINYESNNDICNKLVCFERQTSSSFWLFCLLWRYHCYCPKNHDTVLNS
jgi:hypothetical protein